MLKKIKGKLIMKAIKFKKIEQKAIKFKKIEQKAVSLLMKTFCNHEKMLKKFCKFFLVIEIRNI